MLNDTDIIEVTVLGQTVFAYVRSVTNENTFSFKVDNNSGELMVGYFHAERSGVANFGRGRAYFEDYKGNRAVDQYPATYHVLNNVCPSAIPQYHQEYLELIEKLKTAVPEISKFRIANSAPPVQTKPNDLIKKTEHDLEIYLVQSTAPANDTMLHFGPLKISLSDLMHEGFDLTVFGYKLLPFHSDRRATLYLTRKGEQYKICRKPMSEFLKADDLSTFVRSQNLTHKLNINVEYKELPFTVPEVVEERDPFDSLLEMYPSKRRKTATTFGNRTLAQVIDHALEESLG